MGDHALGHEARCWLTNGPAKDEVTGGQFWSTEPMPRLLGATWGGGDRDRSGALLDSLTSLIATGHCVNHFLLHYLTEPSLEPCWWLVLSPAVPWVSTPPFTDEHTEVTHSQQAATRSLPPVFFHCVCVGGLPGLSLTGVNNVYETLKKIKQCAVFTPHLHIPSSRSPPGHMEGALMAGPPRKPAGLENVADSTPWGSRRPPQAPSEQLWGNDRFQADVLKPTCHFDFSPLVNSLLSPLETGS